MSLVHMAEDDVYKHALHMSRIIASRVANTNHHGNDTIIAGSNLPAHMSSDAVGHQLGQS